MKNYIGILLILILFNTKLTAQNIATGFASSYFLCTDGIPISCGSNSYGELGVGSSDGGANPTFTPVNNLSGIISISGGQQYVLFLKNDGTVWACGDNAIGKLGLGTVSSANEPIQIPGLTNIIAIAAGGNHSLFLKSDGTVWSCGRNIEGQLGLGDNVNRNIPEQITTLSGITAIAAGNFHSLFLKNDGSVWGTGSNGAGQLGIGNSTTLTRIPLQSQIANVTAIACGVQHSIFLQSDGTAWTCGYNIHGELGIGVVSLGEWLPIHPNNLDNVFAIATAAQSLNSFFLKNDGTVWMCGQNEVGSFGNGTLSASNAVIQNTLINNVAGISTNGYHTMFLKNDGTLWVAGRNQEGQLGVSVANYSYEPVHVTGICQPLNTSFPQGNDDLYLYPNPSKGIFYFSKKINQEYLLNVYSIVGEKIFSSTLNPEVDHLNLTEYQSGIYIYTITNKTGVSFNGKFVIQ